MALLAVPVFSKVRYISCCHQAAADGYADSLNAIVSKQFPVGLYSLLTHHLASLQLLCLHFLTQRFDMETPVQVGPIISSPTSCNFKAPAWSVTPSPANLCKMDSGVAGDHSDAIEDLMTSPKHLRKIANVFAVSVGENWDSEEPSTWPTLHLPFHMTPGSSAPMHVDELLTHVHYKSAGAMALRKLLYEALEEIHAEEQKQVIELEAYLHWPYNVTAHGYWKQTSGMTDEEMGVWKHMKDATCATDRRTGYHCKQKTR